MPVNPETEVALRSAQILFQRNQPALALKTLLEAEAAGAKDPVVYMNIGLARRLMGDYKGALEAIDQSLAFNPYDFVALLSKGKLLELLGQNRSAAKTYENALKIAPRAGELPPAIQDAAAAAAEFVARAKLEFLKHMQGATAAIRHDFSNDDLSRFDECLQIFSGLKTNYVHEGSLLNFPRLPAIPFFPRSHFPWLEKLEAATDEIRQELMERLREDQDRFRPYIQVPADQPVNQWVDLNHSPSWSTLFLWKDGVKQDVASKCPRTMSILQEMPLAHQEGLAPTAMFSALAPRTRIPAHTGSTNVRLIVHLPLILPTDCGFRVGNETRAWKMGEAWVFDDTINHEAWNDSDELRVILIFDVWNPLLTEAELALVKCLLAASNTYKPV
jgi:tetratricopeptide (TPR) repeat protein